MDNLISDIRFALLSMVRAPLIFVLAIVSLAVGVAANTTIFTGTVLYVAISVGAHASLE